MKSLAVLSALLASGFGLHATAAQPRQDLVQVQHAAEGFLRMQNHGIPGELVVRASPLDNRLTLTSCAALQPFTTPGSRLIGNVTVGVRCTAPVAWTVYVPVTVSLMGDVVVTARPLNNGEVISRSDLSLQRVDLGQLPTSVVTDPAFAIGKTLASGLMAGQPLRQELLRVPPAVVTGQSVKVVTRGQGFQVTTEGRAVGTAAAGHTAQVRVASGQIVSGIARPGAIVEVTF
jgi:flagellar basal body P-ring formation protein FlgA